MKQTNKNVEPLKDKNQVDKKTFPIVEIFGYRWDANSDTARATQQRRWCPFAAVACEKFRQYGFGYCSVTYAAADDEGIPRTYAVCDHRLDGAPLTHVIKDHFGSTQPLVVPEIVLTNPRTSFDYVALDRNHNENIIAIETQAIDIRGGGVGPAWRSWLDGKTADWRKYFTEEAAAKGRKDTVAYGVNMANIYKRLGLQVAVKGSFLKAIGVPFYVLMQDRPFEYLRRRIRFADAPQKWDVTFITFDYSGSADGDGRLGFEHVKTVRTSIESYVAAMSADERMANAAKADFLERVKKKAGLL